MKNEETVGVWNQCVFLVQSLWRRCLAGFVVCSGMGLAQATDVLLNWEIYPVNQIMQAAPAHVKFRVAGKDLLVEVTVVDPDVSKLRMARLSPDNDSGANSRLTFYIDVAGSGKFARVFGINGSGSILDGTYREGGGVDTGADFRWHSDSQVTATGWSANLRIPLAQLALSANAKPRVYIEYRRVADKTTVFASGNANEHGGCLLCVAQEITQLQGLEVAAASWQLTPSIYGLRGRTSSAVRDQSYSQQEASLNAQWRPSEHLELRGTLNPNFTEAESDMPVLRYGKQFSPQLNEARQFFAASSELLKTPGLALINTRAILSPKFAVASEYRDGALRATALIGDDQAGGYVLSPGTYGNRTSTTPSSQNLAVRGSYAEPNRDFGITATARQFQSLGASQLLAADTTHRLANGYTFGGLVALSQSDVCDIAGRLGACSARRGHATHLSLRQRTNLTGFRVNFTDVSPEFRADLGLLGRVGYRKLYGQFTREFENPGWGFSRTKIQPALTLTQDYQGRDIERSSSLSGEVVQGGLWLYLKLTPLAQLRLSSNAPLIQARQLEWLASISPSQVFTRATIIVATGELPDYFNGLQGRGFSVWGEADFALPWGLSASVIPQYYQTRGNSAFSYSGASYKEFATLVNVNWQYAALSRVRWVLNTDKAQVVPLIGANPLAQTSSSTKQSLLWEHAPRLGWRYTVGSTWSRVSPNNQKGWELLFKMGYSL